MRLASLVAAIVAGLFLGPATALAKGQASRETLTPISIADVPDRALVAAIRDMGEEPNDARLVLGSHYGEPLYQIETITPLQGAVAVQVTAEGKIVKRKPGAT